MNLSIPDHLLTPVKFSEQELLLELAIGLYAARKVSFGKARQLAGLDWYSFRSLLDERGIPAHYDVQNFEEDLRTLQTIPGQ